MRFRFILKNTNINLEDSNNNLFTFNNPKQMISECLQVT